MPQPTEEQIEKLKSEHGKLHQLEHMDEVVVVKVPNRMLVKRFQETMHDERKAPHAPEQLLRECVVYPSRDEYDLMLERLPFISVTFAGMLIDILGGAKPGQGEKKAL